MVDMVDVSFQWEVPYRPTELNVLRMHSLDFCSFWYTGEVPLDVQRVRVVLLKDHDQVVQHGDASVESQVQTLEIL